MDKKLATLANTINLNMDMRVEASMETIKAHTINIQSFIYPMAMEYQQSSQRMQTIMHNLVVSVMEHQPPCIRQELSPLANTGHMGGHLPKLRGSPNYSAILLHQATTKATFQKMISTSPLASQRVSIF